MIHRKIFEKETKFKKLKKNIISLIIFWLLPISQTEFLQNKFHLVRFLHPNWIQILVLYKLNFLLNHKLKYFVRQIWISIFIITSSIIS